MIGDPFSAGSKVVENGITSVHEVTHILSRAEDGEKIKGKLVKKVKVGEQEVSRRLIKFINLQSSDDIKAQDVRSEVESATQLRHLDVKSVHFEKKGFFKTRVTGYYTMRAVEGSTLSDLLEANEKNNHLSYIQTLSIQDKLKISINLLRAIEDFHLRGFAHRDIKPKNIIVNPNTLEVFLIDTGSSKKIGEKDDGYKFGSPAYATPESHDDSEEAVDEKSDIFTAGLVLSEIWGAKPRTPKQAQDENVAWVKYQSLNRRMKKTKEDSAQQERFLKDAQHQFKSIPQMPELTEMLSIMMSPEKSTRDSISKHQTKLQNIRVGYKIRTEPALIANSPNQMSVMRAHQRAFNLRHLKKPNTKKELQDKLLAAISESDSKFAIQEFLEFLNIKVLSDTYNNESKQEDDFETSKAMLKEKVKSIISTFSAQIKEMKQLLRDIKHDLLALSTQGSRFKEEQRKLLELADQIKTSLYRFEQTAFDLNRFEILSNSFQRKNYDQKLKNIEQSFKLMPGEILADEKDESKRRVKDYFAVVEKLRPIKVTTAADQFTNSILQIVRRFTEEAMQRQGDVRKDKELSLLISNMSSLQSSQDPLGLLNLILPEPTGFFARLRLFGGGRLRSEIKKAKSIYIDYKEVNKQLSKPVEATDRVSICKNNIKSKLQEILNNYLLSHHLQNTTPLIKKVNELLEIFKKTSTHNIEAFVNETRKWIARTDKEFPNIGLSISMEPEVNRLNLDLDSNESRKRNGRLT